MTCGAFITGTGTGVGKTFVTRGLARALTRAGKRTFALKPFETGVDPDPRDALALARACSRPDLATLPAFYRTKPPLAPYAAELAGNTPASLPNILDCLSKLAVECDYLLVEGAGGLLVPLDAKRTMADVAASLSLPLLLVASNALGVLSHVLTCVESAERRALPVLATVLVSNIETDPSVHTNQAILAERLSHPVLAFPNADDDDDSLADASISSGLLARLEGYRYARPTTRRPHES